MCSRLPLVASRAFRTGFDEAFSSLQNFFQASKYIPDICVIRAIQKIVWASGCGTVQLVFSSNEEISKIYEKVQAEMTVGSPCIHKRVFCARHPSVVRHAKLRRCVIDSIYRNNNQLFVEMAVLCGGVNNRGSNK